MPARVGWGSLAHGLLLSSFSASALGSDLAWNIAGLFRYQYGASRSTTSTWPWESAPFRSAKMMGAAARNSNGT